MITIKDSFKVPSIKEVVKEIEHIPKCPRSGEMNILHLYMDRKRLFISDNYSSKENCRKSKKEIFHF